MEIDLDELRQEVRKMGRHDVIYKVLKEELTKRGYWKLRARGNPSRGYEAMKEVHEDAQISKS